MLNRPIRKLKRYSINPQTNCWNWKLSKDTDGYGQLTYKTKHYKAHRFYYKKYKGEIPNGLQLDHLCRNRACVNPEHLEAVTPAVNTRRGISKFTQLDVDNIRQFCYIGISPTIIGQIFGVKNNTIASICSGEKWGKSMIGISLEPDQPKSNP